jgi:DNA-binding IclR family transcriptional regulator
MDDIASPPDAAVGTLRRATVLLRALAAGNYQGRALTELSADCALPHATVHRLLAKLVEEHLAVQDPQSKRYRLGPLVYELGLAAAGGHDHGLVYRPVIERIARATGDTCYIIVRSGLEAVCVARAEGAHPIKTLTLNIGSRRPLGVGAGGQAIVQACQEEEAAWIIRSVGPAIKKYGKLTSARLARAVADARERGYAMVTDQIQFGVTGIGLAFREPTGRVLGAISIGAVNDRLPPQRHPQVLRLLQKAVEDIEAGLAAIAPRW